MKFNPDAYEKYVVFDEGEPPAEELLGRPSDYARLALGYYRRSRFVRAMFWAVMASAASSFEAAYLGAEGNRTRAGQVRGRSES